MAQQKPRGVSYSGLSMMEQPRYQLINLADNILCYQLSYKRSKLYRFLKCMWIMPFVGAMFFEFRRSALTY